MSKTVIPTLLVGDSGSGKSSSFRNLDPDKTVILNCERKPMPFREFKKFKNININRYKDYVKVIKELKDDTKYEIVVIDSLTAMLEISNKYCETVFSGYNVWSEYNAMVYKILEDIKELPQQVFVTGIPEYIETKQGEHKAWLKTKGKEHKMLIESKFALVLHTDMAEDEEGNITEYRLDTKSSRHTSAKSPDGMFKDRYIPNDVTIVLSAIDEYYK